MLAGIRNPDAVGKLPADEHEACKKLWADVAALLRKVEERKCWFPKNCEVIRSFI
jgi:hypothetical protein